jgi:hypothetical protein
MLFSPHFMRTVAGVKKLKRELFWRSLRVQTAGKELADWLNSRPSIGHPIAKVITDMQAAIEFARLSRADVWRDEDDGEEAEIRELDKRTSKIRQITKKYPFFFDPYGMDQHPDNFFLLLRPRSRSRRDARACFALANWSLLGEMSEQWRIRRCDWRDCALYFCATDKAHVYHAKVCQQKGKEADPVRKLKKKEKSRDRYRYKLLRLSRRRADMLDEKRAKRNQKRVGKSANWRDLFVAEKEVKA